MRHRVIISVIALEVLVACLFFAHSVAAERSRMRELTVTRSLVSSLRLTDPSLWTEGHYVRNISLADRFAPFQDFPGAIEHFPAGSLAGPPVDDHILAVER